MKKLKFIVFVIFILIIGYFTFIITNNRVLYNKTELKVINNEYKKHIELIEKILSDSISVNCSYHIDNNDTVITFKTLDKSGLFWACSKIKGLDIDLKNIFYSDDMVELKDGTYKSFYSDVNPQINMFYRHNRKQNQPSFVKLRLFSENKYQKLKNNDGIIINLRGPIELLNSENKLIFRVDVGKETNLVIYNSNFSYYYIFTQMNVES